MSNEKLNEQKPKEKVIYNMSARAFVTSKGTLEPGKSISLPLPEADMLLRYSGVKDVLALAGDNALDAEVASLREQLAAAQKTITELKGAPSAPEAGKSQDEKHPEKGKGK